MFDHKNIEATSTITKYCGIDPPEVFTVSDCVAEEYARSLSVAHHKWSHRVELERADGTTSVWLDGVKNPAR
jgi:hypothetical protein